MKRLDGYRSDISRCVRCGACRSTCPTFGVINREAASARGKISLADAFIKGEVELSDTFIKHISECVLCAACQESCPNDVPVPDIIMAARAEAVRGRGLPVLASAIMKGLRNPDNFISGTLKIASMVQGLVFKKVPGESGLHRRFPLPLIQGERLVPPLARRFLLDIIEKERKGHRGDNGHHKRGIKVGFFAGCMINYIMPDIGIASIKVLKKAGATVIVPSGQTCCGMPALGMGDVDDARSLALKNLEAFEEQDLDFITTACATCSEGLKRRFKDLLEDEGPEIKRRVEVFCSKVRDITELLVNDIGLTSLVLDDQSPTSEKIVTYHDPCHLRRGQGIKEEPRELIDLAGLKRKEMKHPCRCCGLGGSFNITNYEFSMEINRGKALDIKNTGADIVATACPGCIMQLRDGLHRVGAKTEVRHVVELLAEKVGEG
ncbi:MAG: (Fe-S)-binding protein [Thermodesulfobacteriota bacterium]